MWWRNKPYDRAASLALADAARETGRIRQSVRHYLDVLRHDPDDAATHARVAPLLAKVGRKVEARQSFDRAGDGFLARGFADKAVAVWTLAAQTFPTDVLYWRRIADEQPARGHGADAVVTLLEARSKLVARRHRPIAIQLLRSVLAIHPRHFEATLDLANLLRIEGLRAEGLKLLRELAPLLRGRALRRLRFTEFRLAPSFRVAWSWVLAR